MFKLESYITPILLSYVDKYIKNFKPEDSQLSLWGGEVSLHNLDLRLEVLEDELQLPFTFVSGHIHELIIHVPWTKLYSEPICITINTIECILKLRGETTNTTDGGGNNSGAKERRKRRNRASDAVAPPGYVQTMVNKIVSNISINCCNLIVKYVEEDIVMSMNVKNLTFQSANDKWEPEFSDFLSSQLMLRKLIKLSDVTICLDKRNASGKIDSYQEPVLYRCSLIMRFLRCYNSASAPQANVTRLDIHCQTMTFNISELQVPMMMRLLLLARALQNREVGQRPPDIESNNEGEEPNDDDKENFNQDSWTGWAWNLVPAVLPDWSSDWTGEESEEKGLTFHSGIYIDNLAFNFRDVDTSSNERNTWRNRVDPFLTLSLHGCILDYTCHDNVWVNTQLGISSIQLKPIGACCCGVKESVLDKSVVYFESGSFHESYFSESLFSSSAVENCGERRCYNFSWDTHQNRYSESTLLEKTPALAVDYVYMVELTDKCNLDRFLELNGDLEYSDLPEHALCRTVIGPFVLRVNSGVLHRTEKVLQSSALYDYQPYSSPRPEDRRDLLPAVTTEEYDSLEENIPLRTYQFTAFQPRVEFHLADHPNEHHGTKKKSSASYQENSIRLKRPFLSAECQCLDVRIISPMYPRRLVRSACLLPTLPQHMFHACHSHLIGRILGVTCFLSDISGNQILIFSVDNFLYKHKELYYPHLWDDANLLFEDRSVEAEIATLTATKAQILLAHEIALTLMKAQHDENKIISSLISDALTSGGSTLQVTWSNSIWQKGLTKFTRCDSLSIGAMSAFLISIKNNSSDVPEEAKVSIFFNCLEENKSQETSNLPLFKACIQWPRNMDKQSHAPLLVVNVQEAYCNIDPKLYAWLLYIPTPSSMDLPSSSAAAKSAFPTSDANLQSGHRKISDVSGNQLPSERTNRRSQTPLSVHSSEKEKDTIPPPLMSQLSALSIEQSNTSLTLSEKWHISQWLIEFFPVWQGIVISIDVAHWQINLPELSLGKPEHLETKPAKALKRVCINLPVLQVCNANLSRQSQLLIPPPSKLPVHVPSSTWTEGCSNFPLNLSLSDLSIWTYSSGCNQYILKPVSTKCTLGISTRFSNGDKDCITSLGLCMHNDTGALHVTLNQSQTQLLSNVLLSMMVAAKSLFTQNYASKIPSATAVPTSPITISESASISEPRNLTKSFISELTQPSEEPVKLSVWLQWTLARMSVNLYQRLESLGSQQNSMKLSLELEDLMAALDLQQIYSKVKLKIAGASIHHFVRSTENKSWQLSPYQGLVMCGYEETSPPSGGQLPTDDGCGLLTATLTRARCRNVHSRWGTPMTTTSSSKRYSEMKLPGHSDAPEARFITEILVKLQPLDFLLCTETLTYWSSVLLPFATLFGDFNCDFIPTKTTPLQSARLPVLSSASLPLLYLDLQAVRVFIPLSRNKSSHDTFIIQMDSVSLVPHAENPLWRTPLRPDIFHMAEQARILSVPGSEVEDRQYELNLLGLAISTGQWHDLDQCRRLSGTTPASSLRTMSENPALVWNSLGSSTQNDASEIVGSRKPNLLHVLAPLKVNFVGAPAIVYCNKYLVCGHALEINALSEINLGLTTNQIRLAIDLFSEIQSVLAKVRPKLNESRQDVPLFFMELAGKQYHHCLQSMTDRTRLEQAHFDSGIDMADISSTETPHSSRIKGVRRVSRTPRYLESIHSPSIHSILSSQSSLPRQERQCSGYQTKPGDEHHADNLGSARTASLKREKLSASPDLLCKDKQLDSPFDFLLTAGKVSLMLHEDTQTLEKTEDMSGANGDMSRPLLYFSATQPHIFLSQFSRSCTVQVSVYNALFKLGSPSRTRSCEPSFSESDFPLLFFESCKGEPDPQTGVPPALCTVQWTYTPSKTAQVSIDFGRPAKFIVSTINLGCINHILSTISACFSDYNDVTSKSAEQDTSKTRLEQLQDYLSGINSVNLKSSQVAIVFQAEDKKFIDSRMEVNVSSLLGDLTCTSRTRWGCSVSAVERICCHLSCKGLSVVSKYHVGRQLLLKPCDLLFRLELLWPSWLPRTLLSFLPHIQLSVQSEYVALTISPDHVRCFSNLYEAYKPYSHSQGDAHEAEKQLSPHMSASTPASEVYSNETDCVDTEQQYTDDLRAGAFQFMDATNTLERDQIPLPYQCVFWESSPPAIAWRYPQPRSLTNIHIFPVPFQSAPDAEVGKEDAPVVVCSLQYWSECRGAYQHHATFLLSETRESKVNLPSTQSSAISAVWRVLLAGTQDIHCNSNSKSEDTLNTEVPIVSPRALAACMRIDSFFSASLAPILQASFNLNLLQVSLKNQLTESEILPMPSEFKDYLQDGKAPSDHCFLWCSLNHFTSFYSEWLEGRRIVDVNCLSQLDILDYTTMLQQNIIDPFMSSICLSLSANGLTDVSIVSRAIACRLGPSVTHTIAVSTKLWHQAIGIGDPKPKQVLTSPYVLCNNTVLPILFGQAETSEQIALPSRHCHSYSWRSLSKNPVLHMSLMDPSILQLGKQMWSSSFSLDVIGIQVCTISFAPGKDIVIFVKITLLSTSQKQITFSGQVEVLNQTNQMLDLRMTRSSSDWSMEACNCVVPLNCDNTCPSFFLDRHADDPQLAIRLRLREVDASLWTGDIPLTENPKSNQPWLVKVPLLDKQKFICMWCRVVRENIKGHKRVLVILSPMYAVRSLLPTSVPIVVSNDQDEEIRESLEVSGQGAVRFLHIPGALKENTHQLHLRTASNIKIFPFGFPLVDQKQIFQNLGQMDVDSILELSRKAGSLDWPLPRDELLPFDWIGVEIPNSYVQASYGVLSPYSGTLLVELRPWALLLNVLGCDVSIEQSGDNALFIPSRGVVAPPKLETTFQLGLKFSGENETFFSEALQLARADWSKSFYMPRISGLVPIDGHVQIAVTCGPMATSLLTLGSQMWNEVRVISIRSSFIVSNSSSTPLQVTALAVRHKDMTCSLTIPPKDSAETANATITVIPSGRKRGSPLEKWLHLKSCDTNIVPYISINVEGTKKLSCPLRITSIPSRRRFVISEPQECSERNESNSSSYRSLVLCVVENNGQTFVNIADEPHPQIILHNRCDFPILCTEACLVGKGNTAEFKMSHDCPPWKWSCKVDSYSTMGYNMPSVDNTFPQVTPLPPSLYLSLAVDPQASTSVMWSSAFQLNGKQDQFSCLPGYGDVKIHIWIEGYTTHLSIEAVSRVEICAKDIRSRLSAPPATLICQEDPTEDVTNFLTRRNSQLYDHPEEQQNVEIIPKQGTSPSSVKVSIFIQSCCWTLTTPVSVSDETEVASLTLDHIGITSRPVFHVSSTFCVSEVSLQVTIGDFQLDNQLFERGGFDFPVVLMGQLDKDERRKPSTLDVNLSAPASQLVDQFSHQALLAFYITVESTDSGVLPKSVHVSVGPITGYIEDKYIIDLKKYILVLLNPIMTILADTNQIEATKEGPAPCAFIPVPFSVILEMQVLEQPLRLISLTIDPIWLLLSIHSSMRVYIALDRSPLQFTQFCRHLLNTTSYNLGHTLSMHYLSGAIFGAGWVVGSLELLGSPGGFARTLGTGLRDFVSLPYHGILQGPWGFLVGVTHGSASLMKHFTAGTLTSVTKMASSVARNLDRLTLDAEHLERTEELRRTRPQGVAEGLLQGLTGLGISLLGAVGGLAHHPLQSVLSGQPSPKGLVTGVGRGLVGVFTKPLSGAADLVAMTGQGLLQGAGWSNLPKPKNSGRALKGKIQGCSLIKFSSKIQQSNSSQCLLALEAALDLGGPHFKGVTLILTTQSLFILSADGDNIETRLPLVDVNLSDNDFDPTMVMISFKEAPPMVDQRMWDFVNGCRYVLNTGPPALETSEDVRSTSPIPSTLPLSMQTVEHQSAPEVDDTNPNLNLSHCSSDEEGVSLSAVRPAESTRVSSARPPITLYVNPQIRSHFILFFKVAQRQIQGLGFEVL